MFGQFFCLTHVHIFKTDNPKGVDLLKKILSLGSVTVDILMHPVDRLPTPGVLQGVDGVSALPGGCAVNAALDLKRLGADVELSCLIGNDPFGKILIDHFEREGLSTRGVVSDPSQYTTVSVVLINSTAERSFLYYPGSAANYTQCHVSRELLDEAEIIFVAGQMILPSFEGEVLRDFFKEMKSLGKMTVMDTAWDKDGIWLPRIKDALAYTDLFMPSYEEAQALSHCTNPEKMADFFFDLGCKSVVIKLGKKGALICKSKNERFYQPIFNDVTVVDTTGAGDAFCAGFLFGIAKGWSYERSARLACLVSASCIQSRGASSGIKSFTDTLKMVGINNENDFE